MALVSETTQFNSTLPLSRYRVVDFGTAWAGPMAAQLLADLGAEVNKGREPCQDGWSAPGPTYS